MASAAPYHFIYFISDLLATLRELRRRIPFPESTLDGLARRVDELGADEVPGSLLRSLLCYPDLMNHSAKFFVGQIVHHKRFDYRGVIFDVDATFQGSDEWYETVAQSRPPKDRPWYHVLVDGAEHTTYVAERHLIESDESHTPISHPLVAELCGEFHEGRYSLRSWLQ